MPTNLFEFSFQNTRSLIKLTKTTLASSCRGVSNNTSEPINALWRNLRISQFELAPKTFVRRMRDASGGRARYGSRSGGIREDIFGYESGRSWTPAPNLAAGLFSSGSRDRPSSQLPTEEPHSSATCLTSISKSRIILLNDVLFISVYTSLLLKTLFRRDISQIFANKSWNTRILKS